ncbi:hypothetical protein LXA43DRAFT_1104421 [Ganoderma leucocontextum]|nr:hypothetical protein LXA43DRAFT_1104421 [Ganoderma leucocontextum]
MPPRPYSMKQDSYWRVEEWEFLEGAVLDREVQEFITKKEYNHARALLSTQFRAKFTGPSGPEKDDVFKRRVRWTKKDRKGLITRRRAETEEEWEARMVDLNNRLAQWLKNWRSKGRRGQITRWSPPAIGGPKLRKLRSETAFDVYCKSDEAPKGSDFVTTDGRRCDLTALNAARASAWETLSAEEQASYVGTAQETFEGAEDPEGSTAEEPADEAGKCRVATAEAIVSYVDEFLQVMHNDVRWGGLVILGGPDHKGEACIHSQTAGTNRHGQTFLDALLQVVGWTPLDFDTVFSLWLEQSRQGPQDEEDRTFAEAARRAMEHSRAQAAATAGFSSSNNIHGPRALTGAALAQPVDQASDAAAVVEALNKLTLAIQPRSTPVAESPDAPQLPIDKTIVSAVDSSLPYPDRPVPDGTVMAPGCVLGTAPPELSRGTAYVHNDGQILEALLANPGEIMDSYEPSYLFPNSTFPEDAMDWQPALELGPQDGEMLTLDAELGAAPTEEGTTNADSRNVNKRSRKPRHRKEAEPSGVAMPGVRGVLVVERVLRPRTSRNREDTMDGTIPITARATN